ncbi:DegT/DnrJ/EryC1/StrS family aminotransferase [Thiorhodovibrio litoralis]|uniref:DegT/DnrJ/EryC1/StrS family aminotransferase n=1 Tax=Thiorhodovibrio litoralis TaxID=2952932 RepID=UPI002B25D8FA|nr:DegT/DnrJ/EryC1/StrS family aminotransferase [Thiorhodovibrio litoralis]
MSSPFCAQAPILVTRPFLPPLEETTKMLSGIWESRCLTNNGPMHQQFEQALSAYLGVPYISLFANGTLALVTALQALRVTGEVITTPYSFAATTHALWWNNIKPVFVDIEPGYCHLDPERIESAITPQTTGLLPVHVYGHPAPVEAYQTIADRYGLTLLYDAAHAFGVRQQGISVLTHGDLSILSFHATKVLHTFEGGAIICHDKRTKTRIDFLKNFGFADETVVVAPGINAKLNEFQAGLGLLQLKHIEPAIAARRALAERYRALLADIPGISCLHPAPEVDYNEAYFPIFIDAVAYGHSRDAVYEHLKSYNYFGRRYFYPLIASFSAYRNLPSAAPANLPMAHAKAEQVLCLPIYPELEMVHVENIEAILAAFGGGGSASG